MKLPDRHVATAMAISWLAFWAGHAVSRLFLGWDRLAFLYPLYNKLMLLSSDIEEWAGIEFMWQTKGRD